MSKYFDKNELADTDQRHPKSFTDKSIFEKIQIYYEQINNKILIYKVERWGVVAFLLLIYIMRMIKTGGFYALTYCIGIHFLNSFIGFISPLEDPEDEGVEVDGSFLPQKNSEEFRPFQRKIKEFQFWNIMFWTLFISIFLTFYEGFDIPVFWPLLLIYFIIIFALTMRKQINHMIKYKYLPWDAGKKTYNAPK